MALTDIDAFSLYRTDPLFLLIGTNPLPNYVAAQLLAPENSTIYLLHSEDTLEVADRLIRRLARVRPYAKLEPRQIDESDGDKIINKIEEITVKLGRGSRIGLNYSGGTKSMAVHAYYALRKAFPDGYFSYLDPRKLAMVIDPGDKPVQTLPVGQEIQLALEDLLWLHGYRMTAKLRQAPLLPYLCQALAEVHSTTEGFKQWRRWVSTLDKDPTLPSLKDYPACESVIRILDELSGGTATEKAVATILGFKELRNCSNFFDGGWLEHYALESLVRVKDEVGILSFGGDLQVEARGLPNFQLDAAAMLGYQLVAISCIATEEAEKETDATKPGKAKEHLFEAFVRARQIGGDEARFCLISCVRDAPRLEREVRRDWDELKIRVFGQDDLLSLPDKLRQWFKTANP